MIDTRHIGHVLPPFEVEVEASRLRFFAEATAQTDPLYTDEAAARAAGHRGLPVPPTFLFCLEMGAPDPNALRSLLGIDYTRLLHGEQHFAYRAIACAGDRLVFEQRIADIYAKKGGALDFVVRDTRVTDRRGTHVADLRCVTVVRAGAREAAAAEPEQPAAQAVSADTADAAGVLAATRPPAAVDLVALRPGDALPPLSAAPLTRLALALYCGASGDHNPIHVDSDFARRAGLGDVIGHGMLSMATLGRAVTGWAPQSALRSFGVRFRAMMRVDDRLACSGEVAERLADGSLRLALRAVDQRGELKLDGTAVLAAG